MRTQLLGETVGIRPYRPDDAVSLYEAAIASRRDLEPWMPWLHANYAMADSEGFVTQSITAWAEATWYSFVIFDRNTDAYVGGAGINFINTIHRYGNLGYWVCTDQRNRGIATEATRLCARFAIDDLALARVEIVVAAGNTASQRVAEKAGATYEGLQRNRLVLHGAPINAHMYSIIP